MIGQRIAALRKNAGMSQAALARTLRVSPSAVGMYEQGRREPPVAILVELSRVFGVTTDYLLTGRPVHTGDTEVLARMVASLVDLTDGRLEQRKDRPFTRQELAVLFAAILTES